jgi:hypothetical protein
LPRREEESNEFFLIGRDQLNSVSFAQHVDGKLDGRGFHFGAYGAYDFEIRYYKEGFSNTGLYLYIGNESVLGVGE